MPDIHWAEGIGAAEKSLDSITGKKTLEIYLKCVSSCIKTGRR